MRSYNRVFLIGNCATTPILDETKNNKKYLSLNLAVNRDYTSNQQDGTQVDFHRIVMWGKSSEKLSEMVKKGTRLFVEGKLINNIYEVNNEKKYFTEIHAEQIELLTFQPKTEGQEINKKTKELQPT